MKKLYLLLVLACWTHLGLAQRIGQATTQAVPGGGGTPVPPSRWKQHADSIFQYIDRSPVSTGLLTNYGFALKDYNQFQGTALTAGNLLQNLGEWRLLYAAMQTSTFNANATLPSLRTANQRISQAEQQAPDVVSIATLLVRYNRFRDDAGTAGLVTVSNGQLHDAPNRPSSPYEQRTLITLSPLTSKVGTRSPQFSFPSQLRFTSAASPITALAFDAGEGLGYRTATWDYPLTATYPADGTYTLRFRLTCADGTVLFSQARFDVSQPPAARYQPDNFGFTNVLTRPSSALFTDTRPYGSSNGFFFSNYAATGKVTVAYANGNTTGTIRKPLIVVEGYDPSAVLRANGVNGVPDYDYNTFVRFRDFGAININYTDNQTGLNVNFNDQLSEVGQYDLIFLNFDNGTDYIQRNAYLLERLIQWVNDNKQPLPGQTVKEKNIVMGMSMGGLVARYALRDMEKRQASGTAPFSHDAKLYISHEAPHQGANVPLGFQYAVNGLANMSIGGVLKGADINPQLGGFAKLLSEPATQQLLIYQTSVAGNNLHNAWLNEYNNTMGYPTQCRNIATSDGSECGRPQSFSPYAELLNIQGSGLLDEPYNGFANVGLLALGMATGAALTPFFGPAALFAGFTAGFIMSLGNFEGKADFVVNALPSQQTRRIYHGKFIICKDVLFGLFTTCLVDYSENKNSDASMLAYDSSPGGLYDINVVSGGLVSQIGTSLPIPIARVDVKPQFCFIPTTSALDIGGGGVALGPQNLLGSYSGANRPAPPFATPFANFITASRENLTHILWNGLNSKWAFQEMQGTAQVFDCQAFCAANPTINGNANVCGSTTYTLAGLPANVTVKWTTSPIGMVSPATGTGTSITVVPTSNSGNVRLLATVVDSECGQFTIERTVYTGLPEGASASALDPFDGCTDLGADFMINEYSSLLTYSIATSGSLRLISGLRPNHTFGVIGASPGGAIIITARNSCGSTTSQIPIELYPCRPAPAKPTATLYPNPARETVDVHIEDATAAAPVTVRLFDSYGQARAEQTSRGETTVRLRTEQLPAGLYFVHILRGREVLSRQQLRIEK